MNALVTPFRQLVDRKLWPLAILLIVALAAVPMLLASKDETPVAPIAQAPAAATTQVAAQPIVTLGQAADREATRKVLGARKNPFEPQVKAKKASDTTTTTGTGSVSALTTGVGAPTTGGTATGGSGSPTTDDTACLVTKDTVLCKKDGIDSSPSPTDTTASTTYAIHQLKVRFGPTSSAALVSRPIKRLRALPTSAAPTVIYLGLKKDRKTAVFLVAANTRVVGDGKCLPSPVDCKNVELKKGQSAFIDVLGPAGESTAQYQLDHVKVVVSRTTDAKVARAARRVIANGGREALRANLPRINGWVYDPAAGVLIEPRVTD